MLFDVCLRQSKLRGENAGCRANGMRVVLSGVSCGFCHDCLHPASDGTLLMCVLSMMPNMECLNRASLDTLKGLPGSQWRIEHS